MGTGCDAEVETFDGVDVHENFVVVAFSSSSAMDETAVVLTPFAAAAGVDPRKESRISCMSLLGELGANRLRKPRTEGDGRFP